MHSFSALFRDEQVTNTSLVFVSSTPPAVSSVPYSLQPSPSTAYIQSAMMRRTVFYETSSVTAEGYIVRTVSEERAPCANSTEHTGMEQQKLGLGRGLRVSKCAFNNFQLEPRTDVPRTFDAPNYKSLFYRNCFHQRQDLAKFNHSK